MTNKKKIGRRSISLSHLDREYYPGEGITKGDVVAYYERVAEVMLPHVRGRPVTMHRWPDGLDGEGFYQKEAPDYFPAWIRRVDVPKEDGTVSHAVIDESATLVYLAQQGCLALHVWLSRADRLRRPDRIVFDLDPPESSWRESFDEVRWSARQVRSILDDLGLRAWVMTSGSSGLHVCVPIVRRYDFDDAKGFARDIARLLGARFPERLTVDVRKAARKGRIFIDCLRNDYAQTAVAPYSLRARPGAPVATPLEWDELGGVGSPRTYTLSNLFRRLGARDDPWNDLADEAQSIGGDVRRRLDDMLSAEGA